MVVEGAAGIPRSAGSPANGACRPRTSRLSLEDLFDFLVERGLLAAVRLKGSRGRPLPNVSGVYQVNADKLRLNPNRGVRRCRRCRRTTTRDLPHGRCPAWRCDGGLEWVREDGDNYDLHLLDGAYSMLRPEEHTAMVPNEERERLRTCSRGPRTP